jgi:protocatechuate 3,4-dioxygenase beta subunit
VIVLVAGWFGLPVVSATAASTGSISVKVTDSSGAGLKGICVHVYDAAGSEYAWALTEAFPAGEYTFQTVPPGSYRIKFSDCSPSGGYNVLSEYYDDESSLEASNPVTVTEDSTATVNAELATGGSISGTVSDGSGNPLGDICVSAENPDGTFVANAFTDEDGRYTVDGLRSGSYRIYFRDCVETESVIPEYYDNRMTLGGSQPIAVTEGSDKAGIDAEMGRGGLISGVVTDASGDPLRQMCVDAFDSGGERVTWALYTNAAGAYTIRGLLPGNYRIRFADCIGEELATGYYEGKASLATANEVSIADGSDVRNIDAELEPGGSISGTVTDSSGRPLGEVCVGIYDAGGGLVFSDDTFVSGFYRIGRLRGGNYRVQFSDCVYNEFRGEYYENSETLADADPVTVTKGNVTESIDAQLVSASARMPEIGRVEVFGPVGARKGKAVTYTVRIPNSGDTPALGVRLKTSGRGISLDKRVGTVAGRETNTVRLTVRPKRTGRVTVSFKVTSTNAGSKVVRKTLRVRR